MGWFRSLRRALLGGAPLYDGTGFGRRTLAWQVANPGAVAALLTTQTELRAKSRDLVRRNTWAHGALESYPDFADSPEFLTILERNVDVTPCFD